MSFQKSDCGFAPTQRDDLQQFRPHHSYRQEVPNYQAKPPTYEATINTPLSLIPREQQQNPAARTTSAFEKPIAIPATLAKYGSPFLRAYPPCLAEYSISRELFMTFLDNVNRVTVKSPPLQVLSVAGNIVGFAPSAIAQITGAAVNLTAEVAAGAIQYSRTETELKRATADIFGPRGLKVEVAKTEALAKIAGIPGVLDADGKLSKSGSLLLPMEEAAVDSADVTGQQRRLQAMSPWIADLNVTPLPEVKVPTNALSRLSVKMNERDRAKGERKLVEKRDKAREDHQKESRKTEKGFSKDMSKLERDLDKDLGEIDGKVAEAQRKQKPEKLAKLEGERQKTVAKFQKETGKVQQEYHKDVREVEADRLSDDNEEKNMRKLYWLIIRKMGAPSGVGPNPDLPSR